MLTRDHEPGLALAALHTTASHTTGIAHLIELLRATPIDASLEQYRVAVVEENALGRPTHAGRLRAFRHLRELYVLDRSWAPFRALHTLLAVDPGVFPLLAGTLAFIRDELLRASWLAVARAQPGARVTSHDLANVVAGTYGGALSSTTIDKIGRNTGACWTQTGHLEGRTGKTRTLVSATPAAVAYSAYLGHLSGRRALGVLETAWAPLLDMPSDAHLTALRDAHDAGLVDLQAAGHVVEVGFTFLEGGAR